MGLQSYTRSRNIFITHELWRSVELRLESDNPAQIPPDPRAIALSRNGVESLHAIQHYLELFPASSRPANLRHRLSIGRYGIG